MPKISVVMPAYNAELYIKEAIDSILSQTFTDFEFLIYNDGSTDNTKPIIDSFTDKRVIAVHSDENKGIVYWLNRGLSESKGKYIARMDADDISLSDRLAIQYAYMEKHPKIGVLGSQLRIIGSNEILKKPLTDEEIRLWFFKGNPVAHPSVMLRKAILETMEIQYDEKRRLSEDYDMWWRLAKVTQLANLAQPLLRYRFHLQQESTAKAEIQKKVHEDSFKAFLNYLLIPTDKFSPEWCRKLFADELPYSSFNLLHTHSFFKDLFKSVSAKRFFTETGITEQRKHLVEKFLSNLSNYNPNLLFLLFDADFNKIFSSVRAHRGVFACKCLLFWKTKQNTD